MNQLLIATYNEDYNPVLPHLPRKTQSFCANNNPGSHAFVKLLFILLFFVVSTAFAQTQKKHSVYADVSTRGPVYTINYDRLFHRGEQISWSYRIGFHFLDNNAGIPLGINILTGREAHHAEFSMTVTPYIQRANYLFREGNVSDKFLYITPGIGYRYQKPTGGLFMKALIAPLVVLDPPSDDFWKFDTKVYSVLSVALGITL